MHGTITKRRWKMEKQANSNWQYKYGYFYMDKQLFIKENAAEFDYVNKRGMRRTVLEVTNNDVEFAKYVCSALNHRHNFFISNPELFERLPQLAECADTFKEVVDAPSVKNFWPWNKPKSLKK